MKYWQYLQEIAKRLSARIQHRFAGGEQVLEGLLEIARVPGIGHVAPTAGVGHHQVNLALRVGGDYAADEA